MCNLVARRCLVTPGMARLRPLYPAAELRPCAFDSNAISERGLYSDERFRTVRLCDLALIRLFVRMKIWAFSLRQRMERAV